MRIAPKAPAVKQDVGCSLEPPRAGFKIGFRDTGKQNRPFPFAEAGAVHNG